GRFALRVAQKPPEAGALADPSRPPADGARGGEPPLALALRQRAREHAERFRQAGPGAVTSRAARLAGHRVRGCRVEHTAHAAADDAFLHLPAGQPIPRPTGGKERSRESLSLADE